MKSVIALCVLALVGLSLADPVPESSRGHIYILGQRGPECEEGTHAYSTGCGHKIPEATCDEPSPVAEEGIICDFSSCYCDPPTVRDSVSKKCVTIENCPKKE